jgi:hypothetical protein
VNTFFESRSQLRQGHALSIALQERFKNRISFGLEIGFNDFSAKVSPIRTFSGNPGKSQIPRKIPGYQIKLEECGLHLLRMRKKSRVPGILKIHTSLPRNSLESAPHLGPILDHHYLTIRILKYEIQKVMCPILK